MINNTRYTKKRLAFIFSLIVFIIVSLVSTIFSSIKFYSLNIMAKSEFTYITDALISKEIDYEEIIDKRFFNKDENNNFPLTVSYILFDEENNINASIINSDLSTKQIDKIKSINDNNIYTYNAFLIRKIEVKNNQDFVLIFEKNYILSDLLFDIFIYFGIAFFSSTVVFFMLRKFIDKLFIPVENNITSMNQFIHNAGHELQTPLSTIVSNIDFYNKMKQKDPEILKEIKDESLRMGELIKSLLKLSEENYGNDLEKIDIEEFINKIINSYDIKLKEKNISLNIDVDTIEKFKINKQHLSICLSNIISNAIKYSDNESKIDVSFSDRTFKVKDNGVGISKENLDKIFDRFYKEDESRTTKGFGIGLSLVKKICDIHNRIINVDSVKGVGTTFKLKI